MAAEEPTPEKKTSAPGNSITERPANRIVSSKAYENPVELEEDGKKGKKGKQKGYAATSKFT